MMIIEKLFTEDFKIFYQYHLGNETNRHEKYCVLSKPLDEIGKQIGKKCGPVRLATNGTRENKGSSTSDKYQSDQVPNYSGRERKRLLADQPYS